MKRAGREGFGAEVQRRILIGTYVLSAGYYDAYYARAQKLRTLIARDFTEAFKKCDVLLTPATPGPGLRRRREDDRSGGDVSERRVHRDGESGGAARHRGSGGPDGKRFAAGSSVHRQGVRRGDDAARRPAPIETAAGFNAKPAHWWRAA